MAVELTPVVIRKAVVDRDDATVAVVVSTLMPIVQASVVRALYRRRASAGGRVLRQEVEDLAQSVFEVLLSDGGRRLLAWDPALGSANAFFGLIAERCVLNTLSSRKLSPWTESPADAEELDRALPATTTLRVISSREALSMLGERLREGLNERDKTLFELLYVRELDDAQVCEQLGLARDALYQARRRLLQRARQLTADLADEMATWRDER